MWNYSFMFPSVLVLMTLLCYYFSRPRLSTRRNRIYVSMLLLEIGIIASDIISSMADEHYTLFSPRLLYIANTIFFVLYLARIYSFFRFCEELLQTHNRTLRVLFAVPFVACEIIALSSFATGAVFSIVDGAYQRGPMYGILYYCYLFYILASLVLLLPRFKSIKRHQMIGYVAFNMMLMLGTLARRLFPQLLVMSTFALVALLIIFLSYENPDMFLTERGSAFNMRAFVTMLNETIRRRDYRILGFVIKNYMHERNIYGGSQMDQGIREINLYLRANFRECMPFYLRSGRFTLVGPDGLDWEAIREQIQDRFQRQWQSDNGNIYVGIGFAEIRPQVRLDSVDRIVGNLTIALETVGSPDAMAPHDIVMDAKSIQHLDEQVDILRTLEHAIKTGEVEVFFQPVFDSLTRRMVAAEALARIRDANGRIIPPTLFIPIAEKNGYIDRLGEIVFEKTCAFVHENDMAVMNLKWINVNLSPIQCMQRDLTKRLTDILARYTVPASMLHLEITEQSIIDYSLLEEQIKGLRNANFQFVLDDYGSGYSNLTRVKHYPFVNIKLDMEVVWDFFRERDSLLPNIVQAFKQMDFTITAEGIETKEMADALTAIGCDYLQGFLFDKPLPIDDFIAKYGIQQEAC